MPTAMRQCGEVSLFVVERGPADGPLLFLLHGFPDYSVAWRHQIPALIAAGYRVIIPDQRGYNLSDKPKGVAAYDLDRLAGDVIALAASYGQDRFTAIGHDWGAGVAWWLADRYASHIERAVMINAPHPAIWRDAMDHDPRQRKLSSYVRVLGLPWLPEAIIASGRYKALVDSLRMSKDPLPAPVLDGYRTAWSQPGALTGMINWYRAMLKRRFTIPAPASIAAPILLLWGRDDKFAIPELAERSVELGTNARVEFIEGAGHWAMWDAPETINPLLLDFLGKGRTG